MNEINLDALVGPTHNYAGLAYGNVAAQSNAGSASNPRAAALQGLEKMRLLMRLGVRQMVMPPHPRPYLPWLTRLGYADISALAAAAPELLPYIYSASGMWAANAATICPSADSADGTVHLTPANLIGTAHRALEAEFSACALARLFPGGCFTHHAPLPASPLFGDEGAANHMRLEAGAKGLHVFVYGREGSGMMQHTTRYPARQSLAASRAVARLHGLDDALFVRQNPRAIDAGVFHNDVIATSHADFLFYHEEAFAEGDAPVRALQARAVLRIYKVESARVSLEDAVKTYLFNSQLVTTPEGTVLIAPKECEEHAGIRALLGEREEFAAVHFADLRESMRNGGGPACLRLRLSLTDAEWKQVHAPAVLTEALYAKLQAWIQTHYRDRLTPDDLRDPALAEESLAALEALARLLELDGLYAL